MKKKKTYWSSKLNIVLFSVMMLMLLAFIVCGIIVLADAVSQFSAGAESYTASYESTYALAVIFFTMCIYACAYVTYLIIYFVRRKKLDQDSTIKIKSNDLEDKETIKLRKTFDAEIIEENAPDVGIPLCSFTQEHGELDEKTYKNFIKFVTIRPTVYILFLIACMEAVVCFFIIFSLSAFFVLTGLLLVAVILDIVNYFFATPNRMYKKAKKNPVPSLVRIYDNRIEEVASLMSGKEIIYVCRYDYSIVKDTVKYLFIKSRNEKAIVGIMVDKEKIGEEKVNFILNKISNKA